MSDISRLWVMMQGTISLAMLRDEIMAEMIQWGTDMGVTINTSIFFHRTTLDDIVKGKFNPGCRGGICNGGARHITPRLSPNGD